MRCVFMVALTAAAAFGQLFTGSSVISGIVIESSGTDPVVKAVVTLTLQGTPRAWATTRTDGSGRFRFESLPAGKYDLRADKPNFGTAVYGAGSPLDSGRLISLGDGETQGELQLQFVHSSMITGRVIDAIGSPVPIANVVLLRFTRTLGERILARYREGNTDDRGEYRIAGIEPGEYYLKVDPQSEPGDNTPVEEKLAAQFYGGAKELRDAAPLVVKGGVQMAGIDFHLVAEPVSAIRGRVTGVPPVPAASGAADDFLEVSIIPVSDSGPQGSNGTNLLAPAYRFEFRGLTAGDYRVEARRQRAGQLWTASRIVNTRQSPGEIELQLAPARDIRGHLRIEGQADRVTGMDIRLAARGEFEFIQGRPGTDGTFTLPQVSPSERSLTVAPLPRGAFLKSVQYGGKDVRFRRFTVEPNSEATLEIVVSTRMAKVTGTVEGGAKRAGIVLAPTGALHTFARFYYGGVSDDEGNFELSDIAPGKYKVFAVEQMAPLNFRNPEAADQLDLFGAEVELLEGETSTAHPSLIPVAKAREALPPGLRK
jgi:hypothetical protein